MSLFDQIEASKPMLPMGVRFVESKTCAGLNLFTQLIRDGEWISFWCELLRDSDGKVVRVDFEHPTWNIADYEAEAKSKLQAAIEQFA